MLHQDFGLAAGKLELFVENEDIRFQHGPLLIETLKFQAHAQQATFDIEGIHLEAKQMQLATPPEMQMERYRELLERERDIYKRHKAEQLEMYRALLPMAEEYRRAISKYIRALANG